MDFIAYVTYVDKDYTRFFYSQNGVEFLTYIEPNKNLDRHLRYLRWKYGEILFDMGLYYTHPVNY